MATVPFGGTPRRSGALIGRRLELGWLRTRYDQAVRGIPQFVLLEGEAGIGKTRLAAELMDAARRDGVTVLRGRCYEHLTLAYLPFRESLFGRLAEWAGDQERLRPDRAVLDQLTEMEAPSTTPPDSAALTGRARQLLAVTRLTVEFARHHPTLLFVDDLDWADDATIDVLRHLLFRFEDEAVPLLVLTNTRADPSAPAATGIEQIRNEARCAGLTLHPLSALEATELARELGRGMPIDQSRSLATAGGGNPLLIEALTRQSARSASAPHTGGAGPPVTAAIEARLDSLHDDARRVTALTAMIAPAPVASILAAAADMDPATASAAVDEAARAGVLVVDEDVAFAHPLYAHIAYERTPTAERRAIHGRIAAALLADPDAADVRTIARHLVGAGPLADGHQVTAYARRAADLAFAGAAWGDAALYYEAALRALDTDPGAGAAPAARAELHRLAGLSRRGNLELGAAVVHFDAALTILGPDADDRTRADLHTWRIRCGIGSHDLVDTVRDTGALEALVPRIEVADPALAAEAMVELSQSYWIGGDLARSEDAARHAMSLATTAQNFEAYARAAMSLTVPQWARYDLQGSLASLRDGADKESYLTGEAERAGGPRFRIPLVLAWLGRLDDAQRSAHECCELAERVNYPLEVGLPLAALALVGVTRGAFDGAEQDAHRALVVERISGYHWAAGLYVPALFSACVARGGFAEANDALDAWTERAGPLEQHVIGLLRRFARALERDLPDETDPLPRLPRAPAVGIDLWAAVHVELARRGRVPIDARRAYDLLATFEERGGLVVGGLGYLLPRLRGVAADLVGEEELAVTTLEHAVDRAHAIGAAPEHARALVDLAVIRLRRNERADADTLLHDAIARFEALGMHADARHAERVGGMPERRTGPAASGRAEPSPVDATPTHAVILFTDVVDSTRLTEELGNARYRERARRMETLVTSTITSGRGTVVTGISLGDGFIGLFGSVEHAIEAARRCAREAGATGLHLHVAVHAGPIIVDGARIYGGPVNYAARVCSLTGPDEILVSETVREAAAGLDVAFVDRGEHVLKGIDGPQRLYAVVDALAPGGDDA